MLSDAGTGEGEQLPTSERLADPIEDLIHDVAAGGEVQPDESVTFWAKVIPRSEDHARTFPYLVGGIIAECRTGVDPGKIRRLRFDHLERRWHPIGHATAIPLQNPPDVVEPGVALARPGGRSGSDRDIGNGTKEVVGPGLQAFPHVV